MKEDAQQPLDWESTHAIMEVSSSIDMMPVESASMNRRLDQVRAFVSGQLVEGQDWGRVRGVPKPFLWKSGAEKLMLLHGCLPVYDFVEKVEAHASEFDDEPYWDYTVRASARHIATGTIVASAIGNCNNRESRYWDKNGNCSKGDAYSQKNVCMKMAQKRALTSLALHIAALSASFTVDEGIVAEAVAHRTGSQPRQHSDGAGTSPSSTVVTVTVPSGDHAEMYSQVMAIAQSAGQTCQMQADAIQSVCILLAAVRECDPLDVLHEISTYKGKALTETFHDLYDMVSHSDNNKVKFKLGKQWETALAMFGENDAAIKNLGNEGTANAKRDMYRKLLSDLAGLSAATVVGPEYAVVLVDVLEKTHGKKVGEMTHSELKAYADDPQTVLALMQDHVGSTKEVPVPKDDIPF